MGWEGLHGISAYVCKKDFQSRLLYLSWASPGCRYSECTVKKEVSLIWRRLFFVNQKSAPINRLHQWPPTNYSFTSKPRFPINLVYTNSNFSLKYYRPLFFNTVCLDVLPLFPGMQCHNMFWQHRIHLLWSDKKKKTTQSRTRNQTLHSALCSQRFSKTK